MRENVRDRDRLEHIVEAITNILDFADGKTKEELEADKLRYYGIVKNIEIIGEAAYKLTHAFCREQVTSYLADTNWDEWEKSEVVIKESAAHKTLIQTAQRMKNDGLPIKQISRYTGLTVEEIEEL